MLCQRSILHFFLGLVLVGMVSGTSCVTHAANGSASLGGDVPDDKMVSIFAGKSTLEFDREYGGKASIFNRVMDGFEAAPSYLSLSDGKKIYWGFKYQEASIQSIVLTDADNRIRLIGAVTDITDLEDAESRRFITSQQEYQRKIKNIVAEPASVKLFVRDEHDLVVYFPLVKRWLEADLLGFNVDCDTPKLAEACRFSQEIEIPIVAYQIIDSGKGADQLRELSLPNLPAASIPIKYFKQ